jgi:hypothetical protein
MGEASNDVVTSISHAMTFSTQRVRERVRWRSENGMGQEIIATLRRSQLWSRVKVATTVQERPARPVHHTSGHTLRMPIIQSGFTSSAAANEQLLTRASTAAEADARTLTPQI